MRLTFNIELVTKTRKYRARSETRQHRPRSETRRHRARSETRKQTRSNNRSSKFRQWSHDAERRDAAQHGCRVVKWSSLLLWSTLYLRLCIPLFLSALARFACGRRSFWYGTHCVFARKLPVGEFDGVCVLLHAFI